ncbi:MAG: aminoacyl-tRNA hydrolase [Chloroflexi bacterium]|nr:aminoacyl-tRNA hydrolase [Chloroflexota bacterium]
MIQITADIAIPEDEITVSFVRASGPGGQNVNRVATAVQLRFDVGRSPSLPDDVRHRLIELAGRQITQDGVLIINARRYRTQERNRRDAVDRLAEMIRAAAVEPTARRRTRPTRASIRRRREDKEHRRRIKRMRRRVYANDD